jgi:hypothetical protein
MPDLVTEVVRDDAAIIAACTDVLAHNDLGQHTSPNVNLYPHQWLWDSCFIAIGMRHVDPERAATEVRSLLRGQWSNGMLPNIIFSDAPGYKTDRNVWRSWVNPYAPDTVATSGITQPPMLAEAVVKIGEKLPADVRAEFYHFMYEPLVKYHQWMYAERDPHHEGLTLQIHPYEVGLDNTPSWMNQLRDHHMPWWINVINALKLNGFIHLLRRDTRYVPAEQRMSNSDAMLLWDVVRRLRRKNYDIERILHRSLFLTEDLTFNCILIRANDNLKKIASHVRRRLPDDLLENMAKTEHALEYMYDEETRQYFSRDFITYKRIKTPTIATFMPLYAGTITKKRAEQLVELLSDHKEYWLHHPVPSVPLSSPYFDEKRYWQGPSWINTNWLIIQGLRRYGFDDVATELTDKTVEMVSKSGTHEYFSPLDGQGLGPDNFSWTAALAIDLLKD